MSEKKKQIFLWYGDNDYEIHERLASWIQTFEKKYTNLNIIKIDFLEYKAADKLYAELKNSLQVDSLFGSSKLIILNNFLQKKKSPNKETQELIAKALENIPAGFFVVLVETFLVPEKSELQKVYDSLQKKGLAETTVFRLPREKELIGWVVKQVNHEQATITREAAALLVAFVGNDLWQLANELKKLANYRKGQEISIQEINLLVKGKYNDDIFQLMDAISAKNKIKALILFQDQLSSGANELYILTMLIRQFRLFLQIGEIIKEYKDKKITPEIVAKEIQIHPFVARKTMAFIHNYSEGEAIMIYKKLLAFDRKLKSSSIKFELLFDLLIADLK